MERIANPVTGRVDDGSMPRVPPTRLMVLCRYGFALLVPGCSLLWIALGPVDGAFAWLLPIGFLLLMLPLVAGAHGSWWRTSPWSAWHTGMLVEGAILFCGLLGSVIWGPIAGTLTATLVIGGVLGIGATQLWQSMQRRH